jgi:hypothetical protein
MYMKDGTIHIDDEDQCGSCSHFSKGVACPLLEALGQKVVYMDGEFIVKNCGFYVKWVNPLRLIQSEPDGGAA